MLREMQQPDPDPNTLMACEATSRVFPAHNAAETPPTPTTPLTPRGVASLQRLISENAQACDEMCKARLREYLHTLARAAITCFAERALQQEQIQF